ncbi:hypothetical protein [Pleurocapsa sp. PCC 7319]|uniref:hypothetical protein n=1 Tax=Pleurocapsa sp. PCC 7319 TaxID=118161 RepID=UPI0003472362|nr:hypothetical protein [Pleurocapsa sp. PCC 7319]
MNRTVLLNSINLLIHHHNFDRHRVNQWVSQQFGVPHYNQLPLTQMQSFHDSLLRASKELTTR